MKTKEIQNGIEVWAVDDSDRDKRFKTPCRQCFFLSSQSSCESAACSSEDRSNGRGVYFELYTDTDDELTALKKDNEQLRAKLAALRSLLDGAE